MSCHDCTQLVCINGREIECFAKRLPTGQFSELFYFDESNARVNLIGQGGWRIGTCAVVTPVNDIVYNDYICESGVTRPYKRVENVSGTVISQQYQNAAGAWVNIPAVLPATMQWGACKLSKPHTASLLNQALVAGNNTITHSLGLIAPFRAAVEARDPLSTPVGKEVMVTVNSYTTNTLNIYVPVAMTLDLFITGKDV